MDEVGIESIDTKEDFMKYMEAVSKDGRFGVIKTHGKIATVFPDSNQNAGGKRHK